MSEAGVDGPASGRRGVALLLAALIALAVASLAYGLRAAEPVWAVILGLGLAFIGLVALLAAVAGLIRLGAAPRGGVFLEALADALGEACVVTDERGRAVYANGPFLKLAAAAGAGRLVGIENLYAGYPEIDDRIYRLSQAAREGREATEEVRLSPGSAAAGAQPDAPVWLAISVAPIAAQGRRLTLWRQREISAERAKQEQAFAHLQFIINYLDHAPAGFFSADEGGRVSYLNATLASWLGFDLDATAGGLLKLQDFVPQPGLKVLGGVAPAAGQALTHEFDLDLLAKDGALVPVHLIHRIDHDTQGRAQPSRSLVLRKEPGAADAGADVRLARFLAIAPFGIAEIDAHGVIRTANAAFVALSPKARRGQPLAGLVADAHRAHLEAAIALARASEACLHHADVSLADRSQRTVEIAVARLAARDEACLVFALDTSESKALEVQLAQSQKMQAVGQLAGGVAHDFNNLLTAILGFSDLLLARLRPTDLAFGDIMNIKQNANRAANLVRQLLAFSRRQTLSPKVLSLTDVLSELGHLLGRLLGEKIELKVVHGRDLGLVKVDLNQFEQVVINLAVNARDAMPKGGVLTVRTYNLSAGDAPSVNPGLMPPGEYVVCEVEDTGTGIPEDIRDKIWEPFFSTKEVGKGTGLGLSTVYGIVKQTGGFIFCDSQMGKGTTFRIYLPRHLGAPAADAAEPKDDKKETKRTDLTGKGTILLVEDEDSVRSFAARALSLRGYTVHEASSGERALEIIAAGGAIDLILSDVVMPEMDGPSLLKEIRKRGVSAKVIFISGYAEDAFARNLEGQEDFAFLPKPFSLKQLGEAVKEVMGS